MIIAVVFALAKPSLPAYQTSVAYCRKAYQMQDINLPPTSGSDDTNIKHADVLFVQDRFVGYLYRTRKGETWVHFGDLGPLGNPSRTDIIASASDLRVKPIQGFQRVSSGPVPLGHVSLISCF